jgi:hypothetical protein
VGHTQSVATPALDLDGEHDGIPVMLVHGLIQRENPAEVADAIRSPMRSQAAASRGNQRFP